MASKDILKYYEGLFGEYGIDERSLGWTKNKQNIRFREIMKHVLEKNNGTPITLLDLGCGFGDLKTYIDERKHAVDYFGLDIMPEFIEIAKKNHESVDQNFYLGEFLEWGKNRKWDWIVESGFFGHKLYQTEEETYEYIRRVMKKALDLCSVGICFDFLSDKVDYRTSENDFHASPEKILEIAYSFSRNVMLDNSVMPFEFNITIWKNDLFSKEKTIFLDALE